MKSLIITVAGMSSRFNQGTTRETLKCLYYENMPASSLLCQQISKTYDFADEIIIVGGYKYEDLMSFINNELKDAINKIKIIYNSHFFDYGSGYSLLRGIESISEYTNEIIFIEGDLFFDKNSIKNIFYSPLDVISINNEPILADKAVVLYFDVNNKPHYIYDTSHSHLEIHEPFTAIYNSGQMWKFINPTKLKEICKTLTCKQRKGTNLEIIQKYFDASSNSQLDVIRVHLWFNCNTVADYKKAIQTITNEDDQ